MSKFQKFEEYIINGTHKNSFINDLCQDVDGMCPSETLALLNYAVSECLEPTEQYLEVGTWNGRTVIGALLNNDKTAIVIDPLTYDNSKVDFYKNIEKWNIKDRIQMHEDFWENCISGLKLDRPIGLFFFDGDHGDLSTFNAFEAFIPFYSNRCILMADDYCMEPVKRDIELFKEKYQKNILFSGITAYGQYIIGFEK